MLRQEADFGGSRGVNLPHWWSNLDSDIRYLIYRPDPEGLQAVK